MTINEIKLHSLTLLHIAPMNFINPKNARGTMMCVTDNF